VSVRLYIPGAQEGHIVSLSKEQTRHLKVLRKKEGELVRVFDGQGSEFEACIEDVSSGKITIQSTITPQKEPSVAITLACAVPKGARADVLIEKVSELGVSRIIPLLTSRSVVRPGSSKLERWRRITIEACAQSERAVVPEIEKPQTFASLLNRAHEYHSAFLCHASGEPLGSAFRPTTSVLLLVGPEGDFTDAELKSAVKAGCQKVSLGPTILRVETAAIAGLAQLISESQKVYK